MKQDAPNGSLGTKPQQEEIAKLHYERQGYETHRPMMRSDAIGGHAEKRLMPGVAVAMQLDDSTSGQGVLYSFSGQENVVVPLSFI